MTINTNIIGNQIISPKPKAVARGSLEKRPRKYGTSPDLFLQRKKEWQDCLSNHFVVLKTHVGIRLNFHKYVNELDVYRLRSFTVIRFP